jgi:hypothetical protein
MKLKLLSINILCMLLIFSIISCEGFDNESDTKAYQLVSFFDLRDRETFIQITNTEGLDGRIHVQIFNVENNCNENNFFDNFTGNDTHVYNMRDVQTNDGNPSGVVLPENAYGFVVITETVKRPRSLIGNLRIIDNKGYEYRTNLLARNFQDTRESTESDFTFNFNVQGAVSLSDIVGFTYNVYENPDEVTAADLTRSWGLMDIDILDLNENVFSCRNVIFACTDQDNPRLEELLEDVGNASVASFEYGINNAIPHSKGGELLCPGNNIQEGFVNINALEWIGTGGLFIGLNNGNGRGSMDSWWIVNKCITAPFACSDGGDTI